MELIIKNLIKLIEKKKWNIKIRKLIQRKKEKKKKKKMELTSSVAAVDWSTLWHGLGLIDDCLKS